MAINKIAKDKEMTKFLIRYLVPFINTKAFPVRDTSNFSAGNSLSITLLVVFE